MKTLSKYLAVSLVVLPFILAGTGTQTLASDTPKLSSSLAKNLWRQAHFYFDEGMDAKAIRACEELQAWAVENNEPAVEMKMRDMLTVLHARQQAPKTKKTKTNNASAVIQSNLPACGYKSVSEIPAHIVNKIVTRTPEEFMMCQQDQDCTVAYNFCGTTKSVNTHSKMCYEAVARQFDSNAGCSPIDNPVNATAKCKNQACTLQFQ